MTRAVVPRAAAREAVLEEVDGAERGEQVAVAEHEVLVVLDRLLAVEVDVEELSGPQRLGEPAGVVQAGHLLVTGLRVEADDVAVLELCDERERVTDRGQQDVAAGLVRLGLDRDLEVVALVLDVAGDGVDALAVAVVRGLQVLGRVVLRTLAPAPHDERRGTELGGEVDVADDLAQAVAAHTTVVRRERTVLEDRVAERVGRDHLDSDAGLVERALEARQDRVAGGGVGAERDDVVVVERHVRDAQLRELVHRLDRVERRTGRVPELVARLPADGPQTERELVFRGGLARHRALLHEIRQICCTAELMQLRR